MTSRLPSSVLPSASVRASFSPKQVAVLLSTPVAEDPSARETSQESMEIQADLSDYRDVEGVKVPFLIRQKMAGYELVVKMIVVENNAGIDDARFAKPAAK